MKFNLKVLSPLHIGCGEEYSGLSYLMDNRKSPPQIGILNEDLIFRMLNDSQIKSFVAWLEVEQYPNLFSFFKNVLRDSNFTLMNQLQKKAIYTIPNFAGQERLRGINSFIKQMYHPYIPGTEIKGAIRTAVLYCALLDQMDIQSWFIQAMMDFETKYKNEIILVKNKRNLRDSNPNRPREKIGNIKIRLEDAISRIEAELQVRVLNSRPNNGDAKYDVMKYLQVGDSELLEAGKHLAITYVKPFNISSNFTLFYEYLKPETTVSLSTLALESQKSLPEKLNKMSFTVKHKEIVSGIDAILNYCYQFTKDLLDEEISFFRAKGKANIAAHLEQIAKINHPGAPVIRIGKDEGYNSLTVGVAVKKLDPNLYENVLIHATKNKSYDSSHGGPLPKSRKIVYWNGQEMTSGWVQIVPENYSAPQAAQAKHPDKRVHQEQKPAKPADISKLGDKFKIQRKK